jgi:hypothetical protein
LVDTDPSLEDRDSEEYDDLLDSNGVRMRVVWEKFWNVGGALLSMCASLEKDAADVEAARKATPRFNVFKDPAKRRVGYLMSRVALHLNNRFPAHSLMELASVCDELTELAYPGVDRLGASLKCLRRERNKGQEVKK